MDPFSSGRPAAWTCVSVPLCECVTCLHSCLSAFQGFAASEAVSACGFFAFYYSRKTAFHTRSITSHSLTFFFFFFFIDFLKKKIVSHSTFWAATVHIMSSRVQHKYMELHSLMSHSDMLIRFLFPSGHLPSPLILHSGLQWSSQSQLVWVEGGVTPWTSLRFIRVSHSEITTTHSDKKNQRSLLATPFMRKNNLVMCARFPAFPGNYGLEEEIKTPLGDTWIKQWQNKDAARDTFSTNTGVNLSPLFYLHLDPTCG